MKRTFEFEKKKSESKPEPERKSKSPQERLKTKKIISFGNQNSANSHLRRESDNFADPKISFGNTERHDEIFKQGTGERRGFDWETKKPEQSPDKRNTVKPGGDDLWGEGHFGPGPKAFSNLKIINPITDLINEEKSQTKTLEKMRKERNSKKTLERNFRGRKLEHTRTNPGQTSTQNPNPKQSREEASIFERERNDSASSDVRGLNKVGFNSVKKVKKNHFGPDMGKYGFLWQKQARQRPVGKFTPRHKPKAGKRRNLNAMLNINSDKKKSAKTEAGQARTRQSGLTFNFCYKSQNMSTPNSKSCSSGNSDFNPGFFNYVKRNLPLKTGKKKSKSKNSLRSFNEKFTSKGSIRASKGLQSPGKKGLCETGAQVVEETNSEQNAPKKSKNKLEKFLKSKKQE